jgi:hypothetical protein
VLEHAVLARQQQRRVVVGRHQNEDRRTEGCDRFEPSRRGRIDADGQTHANTLAADLSAGGDFGGQRPDAHAGSGRLFQGVGSVRRGSAGSRGQLHERRAA